MSPDTFLARALLASGMLNRAQLDIALKWLEEAPQGGLGDLLCTNGVIPRVMYEALMRFYKRDNTRVAPATGNRDKGIREAQLFCLIGIREEEVSPEQLKDAVDQWVRLEGMGKPRPIGEVMMEKGYLDLSRMRSLMSLTKESTLGCPGCGAVDSLYKVTGSPFSCDACKTPLQATRVKGGDVAAGPVDPLIGKTFGGCRLEEKIGQGRWSQVYRGLIPAQNRAAAVKVFAPETPAGALDRYLANALKATTLTHPSLVSVISAGKDEGRGWILTELVADGKRPVPREKLPWNRLCRAAIDLSRGLSVIHANGFLHGDVRPQSVFVKEAGAKLGEFGQAHDGPMSVPGDPKIMAPELWRNEPGDSRTDLYALGVTLFVLATGRYPFETDDPRGLELAHRSEAPKSPGTLNLELPRAVSAILLKLLEKEPQTRYGFAEEVARDFEAILRGETPSAAGGQEGLTCGFCKTPNPANEKTCIVCGKALKASADRILLDDEFLCPKCEKVLTHQTVSCECGYRPCTKCHQREADPETGYCTTCLSPEAAAEMKKKKAAGFRGPPKLVRPGAGGSATGVLKAPPPRTGGPATSPGLKAPPPPAVPATARLKPPPPSAAPLRPPPPAGTPGMKPPPPAVRPASTSGMKPPPPAANPPSRIAPKPAPPAASPPPRVAPQPAPPPPAEDDLDFDSLPPPPKRAAAPPPPAKDAAEEEEQEPDFEPRTPEASPPPAAPPKSKTNLFDRPREGP
ncbi:MAG: protein kinase [Planctomycetes bacterium]|nr:protein kinase [Planctomycetota bacterium]